MRLNRFLQALVGGLVALSLVGLSFVCILLPPVTRALADGTIEGQAGEPAHDELVALAGDGLAFVTLGGGAPLPVGDDERTAFTPAVIDHLKDVRVVLNIALLAILALGILTALALIALLIFARMRGRMGFALAAVLRIAGMVPLLCVVVFVGVGMMSFDALFTGMHQLFFADGTWTFSWDSLLIRTYPLAFWMGMGIVWAVLLAILCVVSLVVGLRLRTLSHRKRLEERYGEGLKA